MNKACLNCGSIVAFPDIPLPAGYTQKCPSCAFDNPVSDEEYLEMSQSKKAEAQGVQLPTMEDSWSNAFDSTVDNLFPATPQKEDKPTEPAPSPSGPVANQNHIEKLRREFRKELDDLQKQVDDLKYSTGPVNVIPQTGMLTGNRFKMEIQEKVSAFEAMICTQAAALIKSCEEQLGKLNFSIHPYSNVSTAHKVLTQKAFHLIIVDQNFLKGEQGKAIMQHFKQVPLHVRRCQMVVLISPTIPSCESQVFYQWGIDLNINPRDLEKLGSAIGDLDQLRQKMIGPYLELPGIS